jgi:anionic cell wall polymer biosynthesis LytR-Cps2A-Psr (LCP) family protein
VASGFENAIDTLGEVANKVQQPMSDAAKAAKYSTAVAAGAGESAAHYVKERLN